jgi:hypothetical protein
MSPREYEYEDKDEWGRPLDAEGFNAANRIADVDRYIADLDDPKEKYAASVTQRLAVENSLMEAIWRGLDHIVPRLRDGEYSQQIDDMFVTMLGDARKEFEKTEELMEIWATAYGQES